MTRLLSVRADSLRSAFSFRASSRMQRVALLVPFLLVPSTALVFGALSRWLGPEQGYVLGFLFYWFAWCLLLPLLLLKGSGAASLFKELRPLFQRSNLVPALLLLIIAGVTVIMVPPAGLAAAPLRLVIIALPVAVVNGICEELLWRGLYVRAFPGNAVWAVIYPSAGFALWHLSPQLVFPAESGRWPFVVSTFFLGLGYGWIAYKTGSVRWPAVCHSFGGILSLGGYVAPSIAAVLAG